jgi:WD40 repeat protein
MLGASGSATPPAPAGAAALVNPLAHMTGHRKAVSYVRWAGPHELVSASTDSTLRLWDVRAATSGSSSAQPGVELAPPCVSVYSGHSNERNFVGLAVHGDMFAAGSEKNEVGVLEGTGSEAG